MKTDIMQVDMYGEKTHLWAWNQIRHNHGQVETEDEDEGFANFSQYIASSRLLNHLN